MKRSSTESKRFGLEIYRHSADHADRSIFESVLSLRPDLLILRLPSDQVPLLEGFNQYGFPLIVADNLVHYETELVDESSTLRNPELTLRAVDSSDSRDRDLLAELVREIFPGYTNHYSANRFLELDDVLSGYVEWTDTYVEDDDNVAYLVFDGTEVVGFATCAYAADEAVGVLYGVLPKAAGRGVYSDIIRMTRDEARERGHDRMTVSTQVQNLTVQKAWARNGFRIFESETTVHINALLSATRAKERRVEFRGTVEGVAPREPAKLSDLCAVVESEIHDLRSDYPARMTGCRLSLLRDLQADRGYGVHLRLPILQESGYGLAVAEVFDGDELCALAYCDLMRVQTDG